MEWDSNRIISVQLNAGPIESQLLLLLSLLSLSLLLYDSSSACHTYIKNSPPSQVGRPFTITHSAIFVMIFNTAHCVPIIAFEPSWSPFKIRFRMLTNVVALNRGSGGGCGCDDGTVSCVDAICAIWSPYWNSITCAIEWMRRFLLVMDSELSSVCSWGGGGGGGGVDGWQMHSN